MRKKKNIKQNQIKSHSTCPVNLLQICQGHKRQGHTDEMMLTETHLGNMTTKYNVVSFLEWILEQKKDITETKTGLYYKLHSSINIL